MARDDLRSIARHIAADNPGRAASFVAELTQLAETLSEHPEKAALVPDAGDNIRRITHSNYNIFYRYDGNKVIIMRVLHGARKIGGFV